MELQQSPLYAKYIQALGWSVFSLDGARMFYKQIPLMGGLLKIQRPKKLPSAIKLIQIIKKKNIRTVAIDPDVRQNLTKYKHWCKRVGTYARVSRSEYMPTKTILVDLTPTEEQIFHRFSEAKRRAVRRAQKNGIITRQSQNIQDLIRIKNKSGGLFGFITTFGIDKFWDIMAPTRVTTVLAYTKRERLVGGVLLMFWGDTAFYWIAGAVPEGKKLFAPTLLVWKALRIAKKKGARKFDFVGVWDERMPTKHLDWKGFTRFKEGFGGSTAYYPIY